MVSLKYLGMLYTVRLDKAHVFFKEIFLVVD